MTDEERRSAKIATLELTKNISHTLLHRMTSWQRFWQGRYFQKQYDSCCAELALLSKEIENDYRKAKKRETKSPGVE